MSKAISYAANMANSAKSLMQPFLPYSLTLALSIAALALAAPTSHAQGFPSNFPEEIAETGTVRIGVKSGHLTQTYWVDAGTSSVLRVRSERALLTDDWTTSRQEFSVSFVITAFAWRNGGDEIFLAGLKRDGTTIVERWRFEERQGAYEVRYPNTPPPIGNPQPAYVPAVTTRGNAVFALSSPSRTPTSPTRLVLWESSTGPITAMAADPEGRYLVVWNYASKELQRAPLVEDPVATPISFTTLYSSASHPLLDKVGSVEIRDFGTEGRKMLLRRHTQATWKASTERYHIISDANNDGLMESIQSRSTAEMEASTYGAWESWKEFWNVP